MPALAFVVCIRHIGIREHQTMKNGNFDVVVVGGTGIDTNVYLHGADIDWRVEANFTENLDYIGQAGGYSARGFARLGKHVALIDALGSDYHGRFIREELRKDGINTEALFTDPRGTRRSVNMMYRDGRRKNFYDGKGSMEIRPPIERCRRILRRTKLVHFSIVNWTRHLLPVVKQRGGTVACDLQDIVSLPDAYRADYIRYADILFFSCANQEDPAPLIRELIRSRPACIVVSGMGSRGCALGTRDGIRFFPPVVSDRAVVDTNGAGDALAVGFLSSHVLDRFSLEESVLRGQIAARHTCTVRASTDTLITMRQLNAAYRHHTA
jgi:sugar/nucleoside kinase (ribokinase family)